MKVNVIGLVLVVMAGLVIGLMMGDYDRLVKLRERVVAAERR